MNVDSFIAGIMSSLKLTQTDECSVTEIEGKIVIALNLLEQLAYRKGFELRFHCLLNPYNRRSATIHYALVRAEQSQLIKRDGQNIQLLLSIEEAATIINKSPLTPSEWKIITKGLKPEPFMTMTDMEQLEKLYEQTS
jgi:hypothetical protein